MTKAKAPSKAKAPVVKETALLVVKHNLPEMIRMWSNWSQSAQITFSGFYAGNAWLQSNIDATAFAGITAVWGVVNIFLKSLRQENLEPTEPK